jgi:hypothetical protein
MFNLNEFLGFSGVGSLLHRNHILCKGHSELNSKVSQYSELLSCFSDSNNEVQPVLFGQNIHENVDNSQSVRSVFLLLIKPFNCESFYLALFVHQ